MIEDNSKFPVISPVKGPSSDESIKSISIPNPTGAMNPTPGQPAGVVQPAFPVPSVTHIDGNSRG